jgi:hypothetical protein
LILYSRKSIQVFIALPVVVNSSEMCSSKI